MENIFNKIDLTFLEISQNEKINKQKQDFNSSANNDLLLEGQKAGLDHNTLSFFKESNGYEMSWGKDSQSNISGKINILKLEYILKGIKSNYPSLSDKDPLYNFHPIDQFTDEAHCGIFINGIANNRMFFHRDGESETIDLMIDFNAYMVLALEARGFFYWQKYIIEKLYDISSPESESFKKQMPEIFSDFKLESFDNKYENLKLK